MPDRFLGPRRFVDGTHPPVYEDVHGRFVLDDDGERSDGVCLVPEVAEVESSRQR